MGDAKFEMPYVSHFIDYGLSKADLARRIEAVQAATALAAKYPGRLPLDVAVNMPIRAGGHEIREGGCCIMEATAWAAGEHHHDEPNTADEFLTRLLRGLNDLIKIDEQRQRLASLIPDLIGTRDGHWERRARLHGRWLLERFDRTLGVHHGYRGGPWQEGDEWIDRGLLAAFASDTWPALQYPFTSPDGVRRKLTTLSVRLLDSASDPPAAIGEWIEHIRELCRINRGGVE